ncbi:YkvI family membrane protein [Sediminivirga luteola]|uniref:Membrane protein YkvI n=1 Tax=Sediminivirga luteola TaxID=1774748 RepID=A0A8J2U067_9MICO|nr:hypothetical protein [Sediminivirga luteola]GGA23821.1 hypothetical protein GCM10011333_28550 [Sediminivirga luteola]
MATTNGTAPVQSSPGVFKRLFLGGLIFQSVAIGGAYATGRESVEYAARFGPQGWLSVLATFAILTVFAFLVFELCRKYQIFDYRSLLKLLVGPAHWLYDLLYLMLGLTIVGVLISAAGNIMHDTLGIPSWVTSVALVVIVAVVLFYGQELMEKFNSTGTILLTAGFVLFAVLVLSTRADEMVETMTSGAPPLNPESTLWDTIRSGLVYGALYLVIFPSSMPASRYKRSRSDAAWAAFNLGWLIAVPLFLTFFSLMSFYPDADVMESPIPWLSMLSGYGNWVVVVFGLLVGWTLLATAVGLIQGSLTRISVNLEDFGRRPLSARTRGITAVVVLVAALLISRLGIIDLVAQGYTAGAYGMLIIFGLPLLTRGVYLIFFKDRALVRRGSGKGTDTRPAS